MPLHQSSDLGCFCVILLHPEQNEGTMVWGLHLAPLPRALRLTVPLM
jgi:hypothetical protein